MSSFKIKIAFILGIFAINGYAQLQVNLKLDSLRHVLKSPLNDSLKVKAGIILGRYYQTKNSDSSFYFFKKSQQLATKNNLKRLFLDASVGIIWTNFQIRRYAEADSLSHFLIQNNKNDTTLLISCYNYLTYSNSFLHKYDKSLTYGFKGIELATRSRSFQDVALLYNNLGNLYNSRGESNPVYFEKSKFYYEKADSIAVVYHLDKYRSNVLLMNLAMAYAGTKEFDRAKKYYALTFAVLKNSDNQSGYALALANYGNLLLDLYKKDKNTDHLQECIINSNLALERAEASGFKAIIPDIMFNKGAAYKQLKMYDKAENIFEEAIRDHVENNLSMEKKLYEILYQTAEEQNKSKQALEYYKKLTLLKDSLLKEENLKSLQETETKYETAKKEKEIALLNEQKKTQGLVNDLEKKRSRIILISLLSGLAIVLLFSIALFRRFKISQKQKKIIEQKEIETKKQKHLIEEKQKEILDSIEYARQIQKTLFANKELLRQNIPEHFIMFKPKDIVSGDFYWASQKEDRFYFAVCDSTGHGVPGAFMSLLNISFLNEAVNERNIMEVHHILNHVRKRLIESISQEGRQDGMDGILICKQGNELSYAAAYNSPVLVSQGILKQLPSDKMPVGKGERTGSFTKYTTLANHGDTLYISTDGYADQFGGSKGKKFKTRQMEELLLEIHRLPMEEQRIQIEKKFNEWKGKHEQVDDVAVIGIKI
ncbi:MAG: SpoIIE family protein phosphatase [Bacteroidetes bacterium]|nr:SpoIIE family protein phosphatase [Bacteroidota bacterium]